MGCYRPHARRTRQAPLLTLPPQDWARTPGAQRMLDSLDAAAGETRLVGGAVRDALLGMPTLDIDLATRLLPDEVLARAGSAGLKAIPTGIDHGTITIVADGRPFEVTTLRRDIETDGRRAKVSFTRDWAEDAARRDFTLNALYADIVTGAIADFFGGVEDLKAGRVRFIGDPETRIREDHLRILRFFRFHARFGHGPPDAAGLRACAARANDLMALSRERVRDELLKLLALPDPAPAAATMLEHGILKPVIPEAADLPAMARLVAREREAGVLPDALRRLSALLPADAGTLDSIGHRLRLSTAERKRLAATAGRTQALPADLRTLAYWKGTATATDLWLLGDSPPDQLARLAGWTRPKLPVSGGDLIAAGMAPGPAVAARLRAIEARWVESGFALAGDALLADPSNATGESKATA